jgi:hypothetical protein
MGWDDGVVIAHPPLAPDCAYAGLVEEILEGHLLARRPRGDSTELRTVSGNPVVDERAGVAGAHRWPLFVHNCAAITDEIGSQLVALCRWEQRGRATHN